MDAFDVARLLGTTEPCLEMTPEQLLEIGKAGKVQVAFEGAELTSQGQDGNSMLLLLDGTAVVVRKGNDGQEHQLAYLKGGALIGEMSLLDSAQRAATARATSAVRYFEIEKNTFDGMLGDGNSAASRLLLGIARVMARRQRITNERLTGLLAASTRGQVTKSQIDSFLRDIVIEVEM